MIDILMEVLQRILKDGGITWGAVITLVILLRKKVRNKQLDIRDKYWNALYEAIAEKVGVSWEDANLRALRALATKPKESFGSSILISARSALVRKRFRFTTILNSRRMYRMKAYLKKLGRTKFQALLVSLIVNIVSAILFFSGTLDIDAEVNQWMPVINMTVATISTWVYIAVEGRIDLEAQKQNVYVVNGGEQQYEPEKHSDTFESNR